MYVSRVKGEHRLRAFDSRVLREILELRGARKQDDGGKKLHNDEQHNLHSSQNVVGVIKPTKIIWVEHVTRMGKKRNANVVVVPKDEDKRYLGLDGRIILKWVVRNRMGEDALDLSSAGQG